MSDGLFSIEFFPPNTPEGVVKLRETRKQFAPIKPGFYSVTFGAGGSTREKTLSTVLEIAAEGNVAAPHISCIGSTQESIGALLDTYKQNGINRLVALRGDLPSGMGDIGHFRHADDLVRYIREHSGKHFHIEVAAYPEYHPQSRYAERDLQAYAHKVKAGADSSITQFFFNADAYFHFVEETQKLGANVPVVPGVMPFHNYSKIARFAESTGADMPRWISRKMEGYLDDAASIRAFGLDIITGMCERLLAGGAPGLHFYSMNQSALTLEIWKRLKLGEKG
jgi:methylenetetrahydrofolate reductase (NADPH)